MLRQIGRLCKLQMRNLFGINEFRYTKDSAKKKRYLGLGVVWVILILMLLGYVTALAVGFGWIGMAKVVPMYLYMISSLLIFVFTFFKAGSVLFSTKGYEMLVSFPVSRTAIVISRFLCMYVTNLCMALLIMVPGIAVYGYFERPGTGAYWISLIGTLFLPLLPLTIASMIGAGIRALSSRMRHKSLGETLLMIGFVVVIMVFSITASEQAGQFDEAMLQNLAQILTEQIGGMYPPALWFAKALSGDVISLVKLLGIPAGIFILFISVLQRYFQEICTALNAVTAKNNYKMKQLRTSGVMMALWKKELRRYFSSSVYVTNTIVGGVLAIIMVVALFVMGPETLEHTLQIPGLATNFGKYMTYLLPCMMCLMSTTSCSISMEGNTFWQIQTLPVRSKEVYDSKILVNLTVAAPFYIVAELLLCIMLRPSVLELFWLLVIPAGYLVFTSVAGISINLAFPVMNWESEVQVVKQSASTFLAMLLGIVSTLIPLLAVVFAGEGVVNGIHALTLLLLMILTIIFRRRLGSPTVEVKQR